MKLLYKLIFFLCAVSTMQFAQTNSDSTDNSGFNIYAYPYAFFSPETNFAFGAATIGYYKLPNDSLTNPSSFFISSYYTVNKQYEIIFRPELWLKNNIFFFNGNIRYGKFIDKFYGIGNNSPDYEDSPYLLGDFTAELSFQFNVYEQLKIGLAAKFSNVSILERQNNTLLANLNLLGRNGGFTSGAGISFFWDSRNSVFYPTKGGYYDLRFLSFNKMIGSDFKFTKFEMDLRHYFPLNENHLIAANIYNSFLGGNPPFFELSRLGGDSRMRGYFYGRFRDKNYISAQAEWRAFLFWRFRAVLFLGLGEVASEFSDFKLNGIKFSYGTGIRFILDQAENLDLRADIGFGENTSGVYISVRQAF